MTECARCGECCKVLPMSLSGMPAGYRKYLLQRGLKEDQGFILIPHVCQHLSHHMKDGTDINLGRTRVITEDMIMSCCDIHDSPDRSLACRKFTGQKRIGPWRMYVPPNCAYNKKE